MQKKTMWMIGGGALATLGIGYLVFRPKAGSSSLAGSSGAGTALGTGIAQKSSGPAASTEPKALVKLNAAPLFAFQRPASPFLTKEGSGGPVGGVISGASPAPAETPSQDQAILDAAKQAAEDAAKEQAKDLGIPTDTEGAVQKGLDLLGF